MSRQVILSNGRMLIGLDVKGQVHDFYYPYVGQENLTNSRLIHHKIGVWLMEVFRGSRKIRGQ